MVEWLTSLTLRLKTLVRRRQLEADLDDELAFHKAMRDADATGATSRPFGNVTGLKERCREQWTFPTIESILGDVRYAVRRIGKGPAFSITAILVMGLGIGANTAIFSLLDAVTLKSLPVAEPDRLIQVRMGERREVFSNPIWEYIRDHQQVFDAMLAYSSTTFDLASGGGEKRYVTGLFVSGTYFKTLGVRVVLGRTIVPDDDQRGAAGTVAVINYGFWQNHFGGTPDVIGKAIALDGHVFTIVGVTEPSFFGVRVAESFDLALPLSAKPVISGQADYLDRRSDSWLRLMGHLKPGISIETAGAAVRALQPAIREATMPPSVRADFAQTYLRDPFRLLPGANGSSSLRDRYSQALFVLMAVAGLVLLVACTNVASLLLARTAARSREIAVRVSIGASRMRLIRQLLVESILVGLSGAALGLGFASWASRLLARTLSTDSSKVFLDLTLDWRIFGFALGTGFLTSLLFGVVPALCVTRRTPAETLREMASAAHNRVGAGRWLVSLQAGLSLVLIFGAVLFLRSYWVLLTLDPGFKTPQVLLIETDFRRAVGANGESPLSTSLYDQVAEALRVIPGVQSVAYSATTPIGDTSMDNRIEVDGYQPQSERDALAFTNQVSAGYFATIGTALLAGRDFDSGDKQPATEAVIVNEAFAKKFLAGRDPIGQRFKTGAPRDSQIVGVVQDAKYNTLREAFPPTFYRPINRALGPLMVFSVKTAGPPASVAPAVAAAIATIDKNISFASRVFQAQIEDSLVQERLIALLSAFFGVLALVIAATGLAGLVSYSVSGRRAEIGIRAALGASPGSLVRLVMRDVFAITAGGLVVGGLLSYASGRLIASMLYQVTPGDPITLVIATGTLTLAAALAGYVPARRAARIDPMQCLRSD
jgi:putative ABC transport system permease protein